MNNQELQQFIKQLNLTHISVAATFGGSMETPLDEIREYSFDSWYQIQLFLERPDVLTACIYEDAGNGMVVFPHLKNGCSGVVDYIGRQTSKYHVETISQHSLLVTEKLIGMDVPEEYAVPLGMLHDVGKKYTGVVNPQGEMAFYGHAELSAYIAARWLWRFTHSRNRKDSMMLGGRFADQLWEIVAAIYGHMRPKTENWKKNPRGELSFRDELARFYNGVHSRYDNTRGQSIRDVFYDTKTANFVNQVIALIELLDAADVGCSTSDELTQNLDDILFCSGRLEMYW